MPASCETPHFAQSSLGSGPVLKTQWLGVFPPNCPQSLELSQPRRDCLTCPPPPAPPQVLSSQPLRLTATWGRPGKPTSPSPSRRCTQLPAPGRAARLRWSGTKILSLLGPVLKTWPSPSPCSPHTPHSHVPAGDRPGCIWERDTQTSVSQPPRPLQDWPTNGAGPCPLPRNLAASIFGRLPRPPPVGALLELGLCTPDLPIHCSHSGCPPPPSVRMRTKSAELGILCYTRMGEEESVT